MRATYRCEKCKRTFVFSEGAHYCPSCGGKLKVILSAVGRARRTFRFTCAGLCGVWATLLVRTVDNYLAGVPGDYSTQLLTQAILLAVCIFGTGLIKVKVRRPVIRSAQKRRKA